MEAHIFLRHKNDHPNLTFRLDKSEIIAFQIDTNLHQGTYNVFQRDHYIKSNAKTCYVDTLIKEVKIERRKLNASKNGYKFAIKNQYRNEILSQ